MNVWFPKKEAIVTKIMPTLAPKAILPMKADTGEQERLVARVEKLDMHNATHGKNVVFWSCKKCNQEHSCEWNSSCRDINAGCGDGL